MIAQNSEANEQENRKEKLKSWEEKQKKKHMNVRTDHKSQIDLLYSHTVLGEVGCGCGVVQCE